jgi:hypothetical protein
MPVEVLLYLRVIVYTLSLVLLLFWIVTSLYGKTPKIIIYCLLSGLSWGSIILLEFMTDQAQHLYAAGLIIFRMALFALGMTWYREDAGIGMFESFMSGAWKSQEYAFIVVFADLFSLVVVVVSLTILMLAVLTGYSIYCLLSSLFKRVLSIRHSNYAMNEYFRAGNCIYNEEQCCICLQDFKSSNQTTKQSKSCGHSFHKECIKDWIVLGHKECPLCKARFSQDEVVVVVRPN